MADMEIHEKQLNPFVAGIVGAAIGAGAALVTSKVLSDKDMRERLMKTASDLKNKAEKSMDWAKHEIEMGKRKMDKENAAISHRLRIGSRRMGKKRTGKKRG